ncbi:hypothetical protein BaRGS_00039760, partial [Batillaria attramentaria]
HVLLVTTTKVSPVTPPPVTVSRVAQGVATRVTDSLDTVHVGRDGNRHFVIRHVLLVTTTKVIPVTPTPGTVSRVAQGVVTRVTDSLDTVHVGRDGNRRFVIRHVLLVTTTKVIPVTPTPGTVSRVAQGVVTRVTDSLDTVHVGRDGNRRFVIRPTVEHSETPRNSAAEGHEAATECRADLEATNGEGIGEQGDVSHNYDTARSYENADDIRFYTSLETNQPSTHGPQYANTTTATANYENLYVTTDNQYENIPNIKIILQPHCPPHIMPLACVQHAQQSHVASLFPKAMNCVGTPVEFWSTIKIERCFVFYVPNEWEITTAVWDVLIGLFALDTTSCPKEHG